MYDNSFSPKLSMEWEVPQTLYPGVDEMVQWEDPS